MLGVIEEEDMRLLGTFPRVVLVFGEEKGRVSLVVDSGVSENEKIQGCNRLTIIFSPYL